MKTCALDIGDVWTGVAISDALGITTRPYETVRASQIQPFLKELLNKEPIATIVVGYPITMAGKESAQTKKVVAEKEKLEKMFNTVAWVLWDERLTSKHATGLKKAKNKEEKLKVHARAAAFILSSYLESKRY